MAKIQLGWTVKDQIDGLTGVVTGRVEYITGCNQVLVQPPVKEDGSYVSAIWTDEQRCIRVGETQITLDNGVNPGCDIAPPVR